MSKTSESYLQGTTDPKVTTINTNVNSVLADTDELQKDWVNGGRLDNILDARASQTSVDTVQTSVNTVSSGVGTLVTKTLAFNNSSGTIAVFTVTGDVIVKVYAICGSSLTSVGGGTMGLGIAGAVDKMTGNTAITSLTAGEIWWSNAPDSKIVETFNADGVRGEMAYIISDGEDINLTVSAGSQIDTGTLKMYCRWSPLSSDGNVVAA